MIKIGFLDSGIGGIAVLHQALKVLPQEEFLYYADEDHVPYGIRTQAEIEQYVDEGVRFLIEQGARAIVVACNTATSAAIGYVRERYDLPILGMEPAVKPAVERAGGKRVLVTATPFTIREERLHHLVRLVDKEHLVTLKALPELVKFAEKGEFYSPAVRAYLNREFSDIDLMDYSEIVLGCTHFTFFRQILSELAGPGVELIDGGEGTVRHLKNRIEPLQETEEPSGEDEAAEGAGRISYFISGRPVEDPNPGFLRETARPAGLKPGGTDEKDPVFTAGCLPAGPLSYDRACPRGRG